MKNVLIALMTCGLMFSIANAEPVRTEALEKLVSEYDSVRLFEYTILGSPRPLPPETPGQPTEPPRNKPPHRPRPPECDPDWGGGSPGSCIEAVCNQLSHFDCDSSQDLAEVTRNCRNVRGSCVKSICSRVSRFQCDEKRDLFEVTGICRGLYDVSCIDYVCSRLSRFECDELSELRRIADQCR